MVHYKSLVFMSNPRGRKVLLVLLHTSSKMCAKLHVYAFSRYGVKALQTNKLSFLFIILVRIPYAFLFHPRQPFAIHNWMYKSFSLYGTCRTINKAPTVYYEFSCSMQWYSPLTILWITCSDKNCIFKQTTRCLNSFLF